MNRRIETSEAEAGGMQGPDLEEGRSVDFRMTAADRLAAHKLDLTERRMNWRNASFWAVVFSGLFILARPDVFWIAIGPSAYIVAGLGRVDGFMVG